MSTSGKNGVPARVGVSGIEGPRRVGARPELIDYDPVADPAAVVVSGNARFTVLTDRLIRMVRAAALAPASLLRVAPTPSLPAPPPPPPLDAARRSTVMAPHSRTARRWPS